MIKIENLKKNYGEIQALKGIDLEINQGEILGFLGPNGAGKSTTLKILTGYLAANSGNVSINGKDFSDYEFELKSQIGYLPELNPLYSEMSVYDYLKFLADIRGLKKDYFLQRLKTVALQCGIEERLTQTIQTLSKGFKQRVGLAQAILHDPPVLILDEPTNGLDPNQIIEIRSLIRKLGEAKTVIISSHILQEVQAICDRIVIINNGLIVADSPKNELLKGMKNQQTIDLEFTGGDFSEKDFLNNFPDLKIKNLSRQDDNIRMKISANHSNDIRADISRYLMQNKAVIIDFKQSTNSLEDIFHLLTQEKK